MADKKAKNTSKTEATTADAPEAAADKTFAVATSEDAPQKGFVKVKETMVKSLTKAKDGLVSGAKKTKEFIQKQDLKQKYANSKQWAKENPRKSIGAAAGVLTAMAALIGRKIYKKRKAAADETDNGGSEK